MNTFAKDERNQELLINRLYVLEDAVNRLIKEKEALVKENRFLNEITASHHAILYKHAVNPPALFWVSENVEKILGYRAEEYVKGGIEFFLSNTRQKNHSHINRFMDFLQGKEGKILQHAYDYRHKNGEWITLFSISSIIKKNINDKPLEVITVSVPFSRIKGGGMENIDVNDILMYIKSDSDYDSTQNLSGREKEIISYLAKGQSSTKIGELLGISPNTVMAHKKNIYKKLKVKSIAEVTRFAMVNGI